MNPLALACRIGSVGVTFVALVTSLFPHFVEVSYRRENDRAPVFEIYHSAWTSWGVLCCGLLAIAFFTAVTALLVGFFEPLAAKILDFVASVLLVLTALALALFVSTYGIEGNEYFVVGFGWSGIATLVLLVVAAALAVAAGVLTKVGPTRPGPAYIPHGADATRGPVQR
ncbi:hypothetical protein [Aeromicrobium sp. UC242_57]|uniref:hypothetical protein n=1 Tax=Aeromicrobium sp. UC242_57 TaxID=3374624 RepID=UPI0037B4778D